MHKERLKRKLALQFHYARKNIVT